MQLHCQFVYMAGPSAGKYHRCFQLSEDEEKNALFHPLSIHFPPASCPFCVSVKCQLFTVFIWGGIAFNMKPYLNVFIWLTTVHVIPPKPEHCYISKPPLWFAFCSRTLVHLKTPMWAKCHCGVGKFCWLNWNALSRHRWGGRKKQNEKKRLFI